MIITTARVCGPADAPASVVVNTEVPDRKARTPYPIAMDAPATAPSNGLASNGDARSARTHPSTNNTAAGKPIQAR